MSKGSKIILILCAIILLNSSLNVFGIRYNLSKSLHHWIFFSSKANHEQISYGSIVSFVHHSSTNVLAKYISGLPGDRIDVSNGHIFVRNVDLGEIKDKSPSGMNLEPIAETSVLDGHVFVSGTHELSFDSRYAQFGLVPMTSIKEVLWPVL